MTLMRVSGLGRRFVLFRVLSTLFVSVTRLRRRLVVLPLRILVFTCRVRVRRGGGKNSNLSSCSW